MIKYWVCIGISLCLVGTVFGQVGKEQVTNGQFEGDISDWFCLGGCTVTPTSDAYTGNGSAKVTNRQKKWNGIAQQVGNITSGVHYQLTGNIKLLNLAPGTLYDTVHMILKCLDTNNNDEAVYTKFGSVPQTRLNIWTKIGGYNILQEGLHSCLIYVTVDNPEVDYVVDVISLKEIKEMKRWRKDAEKRIKRYRTGKIVVKLLRADPGNYTIEIEQTKHTFAFGSVMGAEELVDPEYVNYQEFFYNHFEWGVLGNALKWKPMEWSQIEQTKHTFAFGSAMGADQLVDPEYVNYQEFFFNHFEWGVLENALKWKPMEWSRDKINYEKAQLALDALQSRDIRIRGHNVFWGVEKHVPDWLKTLNSSEVESEIVDRTMGVVNFTKGIVEHWDVNNEVLHGDWFEQALGDPNVTLRMFEDVHAVDNSSKLFLNDYGILEGHLAMGIRNQALMFKQAGAPIDAVGLQSHIKPEDVDITLLKKRLDLVSQAQLPIWITELSMDEPNATIKAQALVDVMTLYFSYPNIKGIILWGFSDLRIWKPDSKLFEGPDITPNEAGQAFLDLMQKWTTRESIILTPGAQKSLRGYKGHYSVVVKNAENTVVKRLGFFLSKRKVLRIRL